MTPSKWTTLPCGTDPTRLIAYAADGTAPPLRSHESSCPYCQAAIGEFAELWHPVSDWARRDVRVPDRFLTTVMSRVRRLVQSPRHAAAVTARGSTTVTSWVLGLIASGATRATDGVSGITGAPPGVSKRRAAVRFGADGVDVDEVDEHNISVTLGITARPQPDLGAIADAVRHNIIGAILDQTGIQTSEVDIRIDDLDLSD